MVTEPLAGVVVTVSTPFPTQANEATFCVAAGNPGTPKHAVGVKALALFTFSVTVAFAPLARTSASDTRARIV
jgi:hypothetical protein